MKNVFKSISFDPALYERAKELAYANGMLLYGFIGDALEAHVLLWERRNKKRNDDREGNDGM